VPEMRLRPRSSVRPACLSALAAILIVLALPSAALGQSTRSWVSGVGDDSNNPCSRTAPCKTFNGALAQTAPGGEIDVLDPGEFGPDATGSGTGPVSITESITINAAGVTAGVAPATATDAIDIDAPGATVRLVGLEIDGQGIGVVGVNVIAAKQVWIEDSEIYGFTTAGIEFAPSDASSELFVDNTEVQDNTGDGLIAAPPGGSTDSVQLTGDSFDDNACGVVDSSLGIQSGAPDFSTDCGSNSAGSAAGQATVAAVDDTSNSNAGTGVLANGSAASVTIASDVITGNGEGLQEANGGSIESLGGVALSANTTNGAPTSSTDETGPAGPAGAAGAQGPVGATGATGGGGSNGPQGTAGATGSTGGRGSTGSRGPAGKIELVTCNAVTKTETVNGHKRKVSVQDCSGKLVSSPVKVKASDAGARATLSRSGKVYAVGRTRHVAGGTSLSLSFSHRLTAGRYTLTLRRGRRIVAEEQVTIGLRHA
jgi:hypothetical protein